MSGWSDQGLKDRIKELWLRGLNTMEIAKYVSRTEAEVAKILRMIREESK